ncbi:MAG: 4-(cytidine 5'-diphospho)-2-C-methyl-D-erythritol kinase, partial [Bacillota bacterium]|nr:4-(cytidine 5'-diphospho)-2-C-methyl-D-erythritol kinase [Bacillota bacterium]
DKGISIESNIKDIPTNEKNTIFLTAKIIKEKYNIKKGLNLYLNKVLPHAAGLGGGSSNSAAVIEALNDIWNLKMKKKEKHDIASKIGTDVHFFLEGGTAYIKGKGEVTKRIKNFKWNHILLIKPKVNIPTPYVYSNVRNEDLSEDENDDILNIYNNNSENEIIPYFKNDLEKIVFREFKEVEKIKKIMSENNAKLSLMSGSGSSVFGLFDSKEDLNKCRKNMEKNYTKIYITKTVEKGFDYER